MLYALNRMSDPPNTAAAMAVRAPGLTRSLARANEGERGRGGLELAAAKEQNSGSPLALSFAGGSKAMMLQRASQN